MDQQEFTILLDNDYYDLQQEISRSVAHTYERDDEDNIIYEGMFWNQTIEEAEQLLSRHFSDDELADVDIEEWLINILD